MPSNEKLIYDFPKDPYKHTEERISAGNDFEVYGFNQGFVVKRPNQERIGKTSYNVTSQEFYEQLVKDHDIMQDIFGENYAQSYFYPPNKSHGSNYRILQERFNREEFLYNFSPEELNEFINTHKEEVRDLVAKARKAQQVFGIPIDLTVNNIVFHDNKLIVVENDCPTFRAKHKKEEWEKIERDLKALEELEKLTL